MQTPTPYEKILVGLCYVFAAVYRNLLAFRKNRSSRLHVLKQFTCISWIYLFFTRNTKSRIRLHFNEVMCVVAAKIIIRTLSEISSVKHCAQARTLLPSWWQGLITKLVNGAWLRLTVISILLSSSRNPDLRWVHFYVSFILPKPCFTNDVGLIWFYVWHIFPPVSIIGMNEFLETFLAMLKQALIVVLNWGGAKLKVQF